MDASGFRIDRQHRLGPSAYTDRWIATKIFIRIDERALFDVTRARFEVTRARFEVTRARFEVTGGSFVVTKH